jgi:hypothetical protein
MALDPEKLEQLAGKLTYAVERIEHMEMKARGDAVNPTQMGVADKARRDAAGGYAPIEPHQSGFKPEARADSVKRRK